MGCGEASHFTASFDNPHDAVSAYTARMGDKAKPLVPHGGGFAV